MADAFGTKFILVNDVLQQLPTNIFGGGPWLHIATVVRGFKEYCCFKHIPTDKVYIEEVDPHTPTLFKHIEDRNEWDDLYGFLQQRGILAISAGKEIKIAKQTK